MSSKSTVTSVTQPLTPFNTLLILAFIPLSNLSTILILSYITRNNYIYDYIESKTPLFSIIAEDKVPLLCALVLSVLHFIFPYITLQNRILGEEYDPNYPRISQKSVTGLGLRLQSAYENFYETYPMYMAGIILSSISQVDLKYQISLSLALTVGRYLHLFFYSFNIPMLRAFAFQYSQFGGFFLILLSVKPDAFEFVADVLNNYV
ncbi:hypothetical protein CONCODRAFT_5165 [Conidiobolus coronatus NRRL 28638]|uniref:MAPEG-domain-containing protein n=1 Tax=Conidiobolus coronatus (strain ATCC 28846 / CBS 209.66 / NRRL 28638) TaxID=796925 RepID=A0A137PAJ0_CONC2|nr:hypothetical protein CONCODRAFT_5165 [Conidiobolus coronatus NRRL 28638]|eukprot:KXN72038.1 hypothetical protein CONCODRAFT_5165 [Conidiobolus coronatus NRRL 28638]